MSHNSEERRTSRYLNSVWLFWVLASGIVGLSVGVTRGLTMQERSLPTWTLVGVGVGVVVGFLAMSIAGRRERPGRRSVHLMAPIGLALPAVCWAGVVVSLHVGSVLPAIGAVGLGLVLMNVARRAYAEDILHTGVHAWHAGRHRVAVQTLEAAVEAKALVPAPMRAHACFTLGLIALADEDLERAEGWLLRVPGHGRTAQQARVSLALVQALRGRIESAQRSVSSLDFREGGETVRHKADGVRLLIVLREQGVQAARDLAERTLRDRSSALQVGLTAWLRWRDGDVEEALFLLEPNNMLRVRHSELVHLVPEMGEVVAMAEAARAG